jgi:hypothetical protein
MKTEFARNAVLVACLAAFAPNAHAQASERKGLLLGASIGLGNSSPDQCEECKTGLAVEGRIGTMLKPRLGLLAWGGSVAASNNILSDRRGRHAGLIAALQYWPSDRIWLRAGAGVASVEREDPPRFSYSSTHPGGMAGIGLEINPRNTIVFELALLDLLSGSSPARFPSEPRQKSTVNTVIFSVGATFYSRR